MINTMESLFHICLCILGLVLVKCDTEKRILLNDPATIQSQLHQYEIQLNKYGIALQLLESKMAALESENEKLKTENQNINASLTKLRSENSNMSSSLIDLRHENKNMNDQISALQGKNKSTVVTYVRWGRTTCISDPNTQLLYKGIIGGSSHRVSGSGVNALCLPHNPDKGVHISSISLYSGQVGTLYGAEYQFNYKNVQVDDDVPCAVCLVDGSTSILMMPAKSSCPQGWKMQYNGILTTNYDGFPKSEYTCMDGNPEYIEGTRINNFNGKLFYPVKTVCGSLPCPPYTNGAYVECSVCTK